MNYENIRIPMEKKLQEDLYALFEGEIVEEIMHSGRIDHQNDRLIKMHEGYNFKISKILSPHLFDLCESVKQKIGFNEPVEFFIVNSSETNAYAIPRFYPDETHIITISSALAERFDDEEMKFVIGHELGHIISRNTYFKKIIQFVFPSFEEAPLVFQNKIGLWLKLSELSADRYGYIATNSLEKGISAFFKLSSGLSLDKIDFQINAYLSEMDDIIQRFQANPMASTQSHPVNPVRVKALEYFSKSELFANIAAGKTAQKDETLEGKLESLIELLTILTDSDLEVHRLYFIAAGGILAAMADHDMADIELEEIIANLSTRNMFPHSFLKNIYESSDKLWTIIQGSSQSILSISPNEKYTMLNYLIGVILADRAIHREEIDFLYTVGESCLNMGKKEVAQMIGHCIQKDFVPNHLPKG